MFLYDTYKSSPPMVRVYFISLKILHRMFQKLYSLAIACFNGFWLGMLKREHFHLIDELYYNDTTIYYKEEYNKSGLFDWEQRVINKHFCKCKKLLIIGVGGGREFLALHQMGYDIHGFECNHRLVEYANIFLKKEGLIPNIQISPRDTCPDGMEIYDGIIVGWSTYMLIQEKQRRIAFLRNIRTRTQEQSPILLSFFYRSDSERRFKVASKIGNITRWILRRDFLETGDYLEPNFVHHFTKEEIASEMYAAGFKLELFCTDGYGYAVGMAF